MQHAQGGGTARLAGAAQDFISQAMRQPTTQDNAQQINQRFVPRDRRPSPRRTESSGTR